MKKFNTPNDAALPAAIFDPEAIASIQELQIPNGPDILEQFIELFLETAKNLINNFNLGVQDYDLERVSFALHTLKSSSQSLGTDAFTASIISIETAALNRDSNAVLAKADGLLEQFEEIKSILELYITNNKAAVLG